MIEPEIPKVSIMRINLIYGVAEVSQDDRHEVQVEHLCSQERVEEVKQIYASEGDLDSHFRG